MFLSDSLKWERIPGPYHDKLVYRKKYELRPLEIGEEVYLKNGLHTKVVNICSAGYHVADYPDVIFSRFNLIHQDDYDVVEVGV